MRPLSFNEGGKLGLRRVEEVSKSGTHAMNSSLETNHMRSIFYATVVVE